MKKLLMLGFVLLFAAAAAVGGWYWYSNTGTTVSFKTATVSKGDLSATISATGTLEPEEVVDVGAQVAGKILRFGRDPQASGDNALGAALGAGPQSAIADDPRIPYKAVDWNTQVSPNTLLAVIDPLVYQAHVDQAEAAVQNAAANVSVAEAKLLQSERDWKRAQELATKPGAIAPSDYDMFLSANETNKALLTVAQAQLSQAKANLEEGKINLDYTRIYSPVKGVIVDRRVNVGQTVVASLNAPSLFLIAKDLTRMQIWASVNEADIGQIKDLQKVTFTVDAYAGKTFEGNVNQVRLNAQMTNQVVTYTVVIDFNNSDYNLKPYLTANILFEVDKRTDALLVPNSALRWQPAPTQIAPDIRKQYLQSLQLKAAGAGPKGEDKDPQHRGVLWTQDGAFVRPVKVKIGLSDGANTEITAVLPGELSGELKEGTVIVTGTQNKAAADDTTNPFQAKMFGGGKK